MSGSEEKLERWDLARPLQLFITAPAIPSQGALQQSLRPFCRIIAGYGADGAVQHGSAEVRAEEVRQGIESGGISGVCD